MNKDLRQVEALIDLINEYVSTEKTIESLPAGYISTKSISGHIYCYRQWREGNKIVSSYVPNPLLNSVKRKIAMRKDNENLLKAIRKDLQKVSRKVIRAELLNQNDIDDLLEAARRGEDVSELASKKVEK